MSVKSKANNTYDPDHRIDWEVSPRWIRVKFGDEFIADSKRVMLLRETGHLPVYYFPKSDIRLDFLQATDHSTHCPYKGDASYWSVKVGDRVAKNAVWSYSDPLPERVDIKDYFAFYWHKMDHWYEEAEEIFVHARDPYKRIDTIPSSRHIRIALGKVILADTTKAHLLFETGLPTRYYIPQEDVTMDYLSATETQTRCPYKGIAS